MYGSGFEEFADFLILQQLFFFELEMNSLELEEMSQIP
jgi:hypothetical protein